MYKINKQIYTTHNAKPHHMAAMCVTPSLAICQLLPITKPITSDKF